MSLLRNSLKSTSSKKHQLRDRTATTTVERGMDDRVLLPSWWVKTWWKCYRCHENYDYCCLVMSPQGLCAKSHLSCYSSYDWTMSHQRKLVGNEILQSRSTWLNSPLSTNKLHQIPSHIARSICLLDFPANWKEPLHFHYSGKQHYQPTLSEHLIKQPSVSLTWQWVDWWAREKPIGSEVNSHGH
jgi:hypothetical protein